MAAFRRAIGLARRWAASHARAARGVLTRACPRRLEAHLFDSPSRMAVLVRVVPQTSTRALQELEPGLPSAVLARARSEDRGEKASAQQNRVLPQAVIGSGAGAGAGAAATLVRGTRKWNGRVCYGAQCAAGRGSPGGVVSLLAPASVTSYTRLRTGHAKWAQCTQGTQAGLRQVRGQGFIGASGSSFSRRGAADRVCAEPDLLEQPGNGFTAHKLAAPWSSLHAYQARSEHMHHDRDDATIPQVQFR